MKRTFDIFLAVILIFLFCPILLMISLLIKLDSTGPAVYWSNRVGRDNILFYMPKFRTMFTETPQVATHLLEDPDQYLTSLGRLLRKTSLDELPQLFSILKGEMSFVGPRPALFNQNDLISLRKQNLIDKVRPGVTGWAQVNGRDDLSIEQKVQHEIEYLERQSLVFDLYIIFLTVYKLFAREGISH